MIVFYGDIGNPVATIENDRLFRKCGEPLGFLEGDHIFAIQDNYGEDGVGRKLRPGDCFGSLLDGVIYDNQGYAVAFCEGCRDSQPTPWPGGRTESVPENIYRGRDISHLSSVKRPAFFIEKLSPLARCYLMKGSS